MKKVALVFVLAVIAPTLVLAWLAVRSLRDQTFVLDRQQTLLYQNLADTTARQIAAHVETVQRSFADTIEGLFNGTTPSNVAGGFDALLRKTWPLAEVGFVVSQEGQVLAPSPLAGAQARKFRVENERFLCSVESCEVYWNSPKGLISLTKLDQKESAAQKSPEANPNETDPGSLKTAKGRTVMPAKEAWGDSGASKLAAGEINFRKMVAQQTDGMFSRFLQDQLHLMFWHRASQDPKLLFGVQVSLPRLAEELRAFVKPPTDLEKEICLALLDDTGKPVALSHANFRPARDSLRARRDQGWSPLRPRLFWRASHNTLNQVVQEGQTPEPANAASARALWKHPFVAAELGELLPHWELAVYLLDPVRIERSAGSVGLTLGLLVALLVLAIAVGSWLIVADLRRQLTLARQKTDFVSNVSHELKTPLTSIRMFSEMLAEGRVEEETKRRQFLGIITAEAARLTRLINNVLDFARLERGEKKYRFEPCSATELVRETVECYRPHLEANGFVLRMQLPETDATLHADRDALAQILVNLLSNAEKYAGTQKEIDVRLEITTSPGRVCVRVLDRGLGVPRGAEERIFEQFHRAHDSLASGIQGSGLGLTIARQMARQHAGDVRYEMREGGGSCFVLELPTAHA